MNLLVISELFLRLFEIVVDTGIQIWNANEVDGIEFPVLTPLLPFLPLEPNVTRTTTTTTTTTTTSITTTTTAEIETICTNLCEGLADGTIISDGCCTTTYCMCPSPIEYSCNEDDIKNKEDPEFTNSIAPYSLSSSITTTSTTSSYKSIYQFCPKQKLCVDSNICFDECCSTSNSSFAKKQYDELAQVFNPTNNSHIMESTTTNVETIKTTTSFTMITTNNVTNDTETETNENLGRFKSCFSFCSY